MIFNVYIKIVWQTQQENDFYYILWIIGFKIIKKRFKNYWEIWSRNACGIQLILQ